MTRSDVHAYLLVAAGGALGAALREVIDLVWTSRFPWSTWTINVAGSFFISLVLTLALEADRIGPAAQRFWTTGVAGGFTTFSTYMTQSWDLWAGAPWQALAYVFGTVFACLIAVVLGQAVVRWLWLRDESIVVAEMSSGKDG